MIRFRSLQLGPIEIRRDTLVLLAVAMAIPLAVSHHLHRRDAEGAGAMVQEHPTWAGRIADLTPSDVAKSGDAITSASLVVPTSALALPQNAVRAQKTRPCLGDMPCAKPVALPRQRTVAIAQGAQSVRHGGDTDILRKLNPLAHLPEPIRHPFDSARAVLTGWFRQL